MAVTRKIVSQVWLRFAEQIVQTAGVLDEETATTLVQAFASVPRDQFVASKFAYRAHDDVALPIEYEQNISKPSSIARMLGLLGIKPGMRVLQIGCGSGYSSAVMAAAGVSVYAVEVVGLLAQRTRKVLDAMNYQNVLVHRGNGKRGWAEHAPYDAILVSAAFSEIEPELISQLVNPGGRMVAPVGDSQGQILTLWEARGENTPCYQLEPFSV